MGGRLLRKWISAPFRIAKKIEERLSLVRSLSTKRSANNLKSFKKLPGY